MTMNPTPKWIPTLLAGLAQLLLACGHHAGDGAEEGGHGHPHGPGEGHDVAGEAPVEGTDDHHAEQPLGSARVGELEVELAQGHGAVAAGKEGHLVVKLPYSDGGATIVRAWIGSADRTLSYVGKATYAADHDDYDVHATAPDPLPTDARWWIEIERPDGSRTVGSAEPLLE